MNHEGAKDAELDERAGHEAPELDPHVHGAEESPLWMVSQTPALNELVVSLRRFRRTLDEGMGGKLAFSRRTLALARCEFGDMIRRGEHDLHRLGGLLAEKLLGTHRLRSVVIGEVEKTRERFTLSFDVSASEVVQSTDLDLGTRMLARLAIADAQGWLRASLISNVIEYEAEEPNEAGAVRILTRIKAEEEIWNKVADEIFELDRIVLRDKQLRHLGQYVKDVFGVKIVVASKEDALRLQNALMELRFDADKLRARDVPVNDDLTRFTFVEVKDYLTQSSRKRSGWSAMKSVVKWGGRTFEIQVQPLSNFLHERERLTKESHASFKTTRERVRDEVAERLPLFSFYRALLRWLFVDSSADAPRHEGVEISLVD